jgi:hypothetical protein
MTSSWPAPPRRSPWLGLLPIYLGYIGVALATTISWSVDQSILRTIVRGVCGWFYVIYYAATR